jgi:hypothetical protein
VRLLFKSNFFIHITSVTSESVGQGSRLPHQLSTPHHLLPIMAQPSITRLPCNEADILLAISALRQGHVHGVNQAAALYNVPQSTLSNRLAGKPARRDCEPKSKKVTTLEEEVIVAYILDLDARGFPPSLDAVRNMANKLLAKREAEPVGIK